LTTLQGWTVRREQQARLLGIAWNESGQRGYRGRAAAGQGGCRAGRGRNRIEGGQPPLGGRLLPLVQRKTGQCTRVGACVGSCLCVPFKLAVWPPNAQLGGSRAGAGQGIQLCTTAKLPKRQGCFGGGALTPGPQGQCHRCGSATTQRQHCSGAVTSLQALKVGVQQLGVGGALDL